MAAAGNRTWRNHKNFHVVVCVCERRGNITFFCACFCTHRAIRNARSLSGSVSVRAKKTNSDKYVYYLCCFSREHWTHIVPVAKFLFFPFSTKKNEELASNRRTRHRHRRRRRWCSFIFLVCFSCDPRWTQAEVKTSPSQPLHYY